MTKKGKNAMIVLVLLAVALLLGNAGLFSVAEEDITHVSINRDCAYFFQSQLDDDLVYPADATLNLVPFKEFCFIGIDDGLEYRLVTQMGSSTIDAGCVYDYTVVEKSECPSFSNVNGSGSAGTSEPIFTLGGFEVTWIHLLIVIVLIIGLVAVKK